jgi:hypothetical protein
MPLLIAFMNLVGIHILDLPAWYYGWVGHVISMLGAGDRPAAPFHLDRIYTLLHYIEPLCPMPF